MEKRIHDYFVQYEQEVLKQAIRSLKYAIVRILDTETTHLYNALIYNTVKNKVIEAEVFGEHDNCNGVCENGCKGYCSNICQTYCETAQTFTENLSPIPNSIGQSKFYWNNVAPEATIEITAEQWNNLKNKIIASIPYCGGAAPNMTAASNDIISAEIYNDLANGLETATVNSEDIISADIINALQNAYNNRQIKNTLPNGKNPSSGSRDECCQSGQVCMEEEEVLAPHQVKTEECGIGTQVATPICSSQAETNTYPNGYGPSTCLDQIV